MHVPLLLLHFPPCIVQALGDNCCLSFSATPILCLPQVGLAASFLSGLLQLALAPFARFMYAYIPRVALMSGLSGLGMVFLSLRFAASVFSQPSYAILPLVVMFLTYAASVRPPFGIPGSFVAICGGTATAWIIRSIEPSSEVRAHTHTHRHTYPNTQTHTQTSIRTSPNIHTHIPKHTHTSQTHIHTFPNTRTHPHMHIRLRRRCVCSIPLLPLPIRAPVCGFRVYRPGLQLWQFVFHPNPVFRSDSGWLEWPAAPQASVDRLITGFQDLHILGDSSVIMSLTIVGTVSNLAMLESARALGDNFPVVPTLVITSLVTMMSALFGCPFPTSVYIGASMSCGQRCSFVWRGVGRCGLSSLAARRMRAAFG